MKPALKAVPVSADAPDMAAKPLVSVSGLSVLFPRADGSQLNIVEKLDLEIAPGEVVGIVGESGSGKSMTARAMMRLLPSNALLSGSIEIDGNRILDLNEKELRRLRGSTAAMVFQDPMTSFNPVRTIKSQIAEALRVHSAKAIPEKVVSLLSAVGIPNAAARANEYPHAYSGGMRQRAMIAMAVANSPKLLIADEPTTALDATIQDNILEQLRNLNRESKTAIVLITHNIAVVASICTRVLVMYSGRVVEEASVTDALERPQHPYTWMLLRSVPRLDRSSDRLVAISGSPPDPTAPPAGCRFHPRCPFARERCRVEEPDLQETETGGKARCFYRMADLLAEGGNDA